MERIECYMAQTLTKRKEKGSLRQLSPTITLSSASTSQSNELLLSTEWSPTEKDDDRMKRNPEQELHYVAQTLSTTTDACRNIDFSSNDYLGLASSKYQIQLVQDTFNRSYAHQVPNYSTPILGSTGSRLLSGDSVQFHMLEHKLAKYHNRLLALLFNSGYDANLSVVSCLPCAIILYDEYCHNSLQMGIRLWESYEKTTMTTSSSEVNDPTQQCNKRKKSLSFQHNNLKDLGNKLDELMRSRTYSDDSTHESVCIIIESVYSMDGDIAPVSEILDIATKYNAVVVVDEAHSLGVFGTKGMGILSSPALSSSSSLQKQNTRNRSSSSNSMEQHIALLCSIHTFGKGAGCHGAVVCTNSRLYQQYLVNYAYPFIYSTALPYHSLVTIQCAYQTITDGMIGTALRDSVMELIQLFRSSLLSVLQHSNHKKSSSSSSQSCTVTLLNSMTPIQALLIPGGNDVCSLFCNTLYKKSNSTIKLYPIKSPTVPIGTERVRIVIHANNTREQVLLLVRLVLATAHELNLLGTNIASNTIGYPTTSSKNNIVSTHMRSYL